MDEVKLTKVRAESEDDWDDGTPVTFVPQRDFKTHAEIQKAFYNGLLDRLTTGCHLMLAELIIQTLILLLLLWYGLR